MGDEEKWKAAVKEFSRVLNSWVYADIDNDDFRIVQTGLQEILQKHGLSLDQTKECKHEVLQTQDSVGNEYYACQKCDETFWTLAGVYEAGGTEKP